MAITVLKNTRIHAVVVVSHSTTASETINISTLLADGQTAATPKVNISAIHYSSPDGSVCTITRNSVQLWTFDRAFNIDMSGYSDSRENGSNIAVAIGSGGGTVVIELKKVSGYSDSQHPYQSLPS